MLYAPDLVGIAMPPFIEVFNRVFGATNSLEKKVVTLVTCLAVAMLLHWNEIAAWQWFDFVTNFGLIWLWSQGVFGFWFNGSKGPFLSQEWINNLLNFVTKVKLELPSRAIETK